MDEDREGSPPGEASKFNVASFSRDVLIFSSGQALIFVVGAIMGLLVPKFLSVAGYGYYQTFMLYTNYVSLLHLGFIDGALVRWAKGGEELIRKELKSHFIYLTIQLLVLISLLSIICLFLQQSNNQFIFVAVLIFAFIYNLGFLCVFASQATRKFKSLTLINIIKAVLVFCLVLIIFITRNNEFYMVIVAILMGQLVFGAMIVYLSRGYFKGQVNMRSLWTQAKPNLDIGVFILFGNFIIVLFMTLDRLVVNTLFPMEQFAIYSFAMSITMIAYLFISSVSQVFFPYLTRSQHELRTGAYRLGKPSVILAWCGILTIYFPFVWVINRFFPQYVESIPLLAVLICSVAFGGTIQILHVNYYMSYDKQKRYFLIALMSLAIFILLLAAALIFYKTLLSITVATLIGLTAWYIANELYLNRILKFRLTALLKDFAIIIIVTAVFLISSSLHIGLILQLVLYLVATAVVVTVFLRREIVELFELAVSVIKAGKPVGSD
jgi:O-antigen/teichoic acid export membrane protein